MSSPVVRVPFGGRVPGRFLDLPRVTVTVLVRGPLPPVAPKLLGSLSVGTMARGQRIHPYCVRCGAVYHLSVTRRPHGRKGGRLDTSQGRALL